MEQKRKIVPPVYLLVAIVLMVLMNRSWPVLRWTEPPASEAGWLLVVAGLVVMGVSAYAFHRVDTGIVPFDDATTLVTSGFYRFTRNPMYLGMVIILLGGAIRAGSFGALVPIPLFIWVIRQQFILAEERFLEDAFGEQYLDYTKRVRRWL